MERKETCKKNEEKNEKQKPLLALHGLAQVTDDVGGRWPRP